MRENPSFMITLPKMIGVISHLIANLLYAVSTVLGKLLFNRGLGVGQLLLFSCSIQVLLTSYIAFHRIDRKRVKSLLLLGFLGGLAKAGKFAAVYFADPGNVLVFVNLVVPFSLAFAHICFHQL